MQRRWDVSDKCIVPGFDSCYTSSVIVETIALGIGLDTHPLRFPLG